MNRRKFLKTSAALAISSQASLRLQAAALSERAGKAVEMANSEIWRRFVDIHGVLVDFTDLDGTVSLPTPDECRAGKPNALGWWTPIENGAMFNGFYLDGALIKARLTGSRTEHTKVVRLVEGLLRLASCSDVKGFVGRGFARDGKTTWPMGSNDQTGPWFVGLWRFLQSGLGDAKLRKRVETKLTEVAQVLVETGWRMPAEAPFDFRSSFHGFSWEDAPRLLFVCKAMHRLTGDAGWDERYRSALYEEPRNGGRTRLQHCERGMVFERNGVPKPGRATWTGASSAIALRGLWELERDDALRGAYERGLRATARMAVEGLDYRHRFSSNDSSHYESDWRKLNRYWKPQYTDTEAVEVARVQLKAINEMSPRRRVELTFAREAAFAAWVVTLCPDRAVVGQHKPEILGAIAHFEPAKMYFVTYFPIENAWWRIKELSV